MFTDDKKSEIVSRLGERLVKHAHDMKCPMCENRDFTIADKYVLVDLQDDLNVVNLGGQAIPSVAIVCDNCGLAIFRSLL